MYCTHMIKYKFGYKDNKDVAHKQGFLKKCDLDTAFVRCGWQLHCPVAVLQLLQFQNRFPQGQK